MNIHSVKTVKKCLSILIVIQLKVLTSAYQLIFIQLKELTSAYQLIVIQLNY